MTNNTTVSNYDTGLLQRRRSSLQVHYQYQRKPSTRLIALCPIDTKAASSFQDTTLPSSASLLSASTNSATSPYSAFFSPASASTPSAFLPIHPPPSPTITSYNQRHRRPSNGSTSPATPRSPPSALAAASPSSFTSPISPSALEFRRLSLKSPIPTFSAAAWRRHLYPLKYGSLRVLVVDDNDINLQILAKALKIHMSDIFQYIDLVPSGHKAIEQLQLHTYDLILMDIDMPGLNGLEATSWIRRGHLTPLASSPEDDVVSLSDNDTSLLPVLIQNRRVPIVAVTTNMTMDWKKRFLRAGMNGCLSKPVSPFNLKHSLTQVLFYGSYWDYSSS
ncbi:CheY-like protein [Hesseltinella vesiculosa]|uniref:CheY-like protein n=1 Tax=Hesseltinella vesiculosa TaxID=101127 RepID=A0A1X2G9U4_9FUNG|nr:CheY-like protein [Hesseltinella vesiculosa]